MPDEEACRKAGFVPVPVKDRRFPREYESLEAAAYRASGGKFTIQPSLEAVRRGDYAFPRKPRKVLKRFTP